MPPSMAKNPWRAFVLAAVLVMIAATLVRVPSEFRRLAFEPWGHGSAIDLKKRFVEVHEWFAGRPVYGVVESADYPPASYPILFPLAFWPTLKLAQVMVALSMAAALAWLTAVAVRASGSQDRAVRLFAALLPLSMYATAANIRIGQLGVYLMPLLITGTLLLAEEKRTLRVDIAASALLVAALVKPTFSVPFMWIAFFRGGARPALLISGLYAALTVVSASFQDASIPALVHGWLGQSANIEFNTAHANLYTWLDAVGLGRYLLAGSLLVLVASGVWTWWHRHGDIWILLAVAAIVSRIWTYHRWYDDILMLIPLITLLRMVATGQAVGRADKAAMALLALIWAFGLAPVQVRSELGAWSEVFKIAKTTTWLATLGLLLLRARPRAAG